MTVTPGGVSHDPSVLDLLGLPTAGDVYDLDPGRWPGMPIWAGHPPFQVMTYRTPNGIRVGGDQEWLNGQNNQVKVGLISELMMGTNHTGSHVDALGHITIEDDSWHNGNTTDNLSDFGPTVGDAASMSPFITRGLMVDVAAHLGVQRLAKSHPITLEEFQGALDAQSLEVREGDVVLVRTGQMSVWPDKEKMAETIGAGITREVAQYCVERNVRGVGTDTEACEVMPSIEPGHPHPVHEVLLIRAGIHIFENIYLEDLSHAKAGSFLFLALPLKVVGATGSMLRPLAIA